MWKTLTQKRKKKKEVSFGENSERQLSYDTKPLNKLLARELREDIRDTKYDILNGEDNIVYHTSEIPRSSEVKLKEHSIKTLEKANQSKNNPTGCTICGGKRRKTRKTRKSKKRRNAK